MASMALVLGLQTEGGCAITVLDDQMVTGKAKPSCGLHEGDRIISSRRDLWAMFI